MSECGSCGGILENEGNYKLHTKLGHEDKSLCVELLRARVEDLEAEVAGLKAHPLMVLCGKCGHVEQINPTTTPAPAKCKECGGDGYTLVLDAAGSPTGYGKPCPSCGGTGEGKL
jgi:ribosomal protein S27E